MPTLYLDLDGTVIDVRRRHYAAYAEALRRLGHLPLTEAQYWERRRAGASSSDLIRDLRASFLAGWLPLVESRRYLRLDTVVPGAREALRALDGPYDLVLVTMRRDGATLEDQLESLDLLRFFSAVLSRSDAPRADAKADLIRLHAGSAVSDATVVGDSEGDVEAARALGWPVVCVTTGVRDGRFLRRLDPDDLLDSIADLPQALSERRALAAAR